MSGSKDEANGSSRISSEGGFLHNLSSGSFKPYDHDATSTQLVRILLETLIASEDKIWLKTDVWPAELMQAI